MEEMQGICLLVKFVFMKPTSMIKNVHLSFLVKKEHISKISYCTKHSNNNREALNLHGCVNNGTSARVTSSAGLYCPWVIVSQKMPARHV